MTKSQIPELPEYFDRYIALVDDIELLDAFNQSVQQLTTLDIELLELLHSKRYERNKWTVNEVLQHITDTERLLCSGTLRFARKENNFVISFDEKKLAISSKADERSIKEILDELLSVRLSTISLYKTFDSKDLLKTGINWKYRISIVAMGFNIIGHQIHHLNIFNERYLPLIK